MSLGAGTSSRASDHLTPAVKKYPRDAGSPKGGGTSGSGGEAATPPEIREKKEVKLRTRAHAGTVDFVV